ncbi:hypothetical protein AC70_3468 [Escherichia coli 2-210-07_S4_C1]|nr:hypothetical protein AC70_3468 [Escherichia coli 2-210-07_S4_C1]
MDELRAEIAFAQNGEKPWPYRACRESEGVGCCEKHGKYRTHILVWDDRQGGAVSKISRCREHHNELHADPLVFEEKHGSQVDLIFHFLDHAFATGVLG